MYPVSAIGSAELFAKVLRAMIVFEKTRQAGAIKKENVLAELKLALGDSSFNELQPWIEVAIESIVLISKSGIDISKIKPKGLFACCKC